MRVRITVAAVGVAGTTMQNVDVIANADSLVFRTGPAEVFLSRESAQDIMITSEEGALSFSIDTSTYVSSEEVAALSSNLASAAGLLCILSKMSRALLLAVRRL